VSPEFPHEARPNIMVTTTAAGAATARIG